MSERGDGMVSGENPERAASCVSSHETPSSRSLTRWLRDGEGPQICRCGCLESRHVWDKTFTTAACRDCECFDWYDIEPACIATNLNNLAGDLRRIGWHRRADYLLTVAGWLESDFVQRSYNSEDKPNALG